MMTEEKLEVEPETVAEQPAEEPVEENLMETMEKEVEAEAVKTEEAPAEAAALKLKRRNLKKKLLKKKTYTVPLSKALIMPPRKRAPRAMRILRAYIIKHMKIPARAEEEDEEPPSLIITKEVNEHIWGRGIEKPHAKSECGQPKTATETLPVHLAEGD
jgi:large subunit ribosomal protein L31e